MNTRFFNTDSRTEAIKGVHFKEIVPSNIIELDSSNPFFSEVPSGKMIEFDNSGIPVRLVSIPEKTTEQVLLDCCIALKEKRKSEVCSGVVVNGVAMQSDDKSIAKMDQYATESMMNGLTVVHWEKSDGSFHDWPIADFKKLFSEITKYVNECFGRQSQLLDEINSSSDPQAVDISTGWPSKEITF